MFQEYFRHRMGPQHCSSIAVRTGIQPGSRPWTSRMVRVPLTQLSRSMQFVHQIGVSVEAVGFDYGSGSSSPKTKTVTETPAQEETTKPKRRSTRRKR